MKNSFDFTVEGMTCGGCVKRITQTILKLDQNALVNADLDNKNVHVETESQTFETISPELEKIGYPAKLNLN